MGKPAIFDYFSHMRIFTSHMRIFLFFNWAKFLQNFGWNFRKTYLFVKLLHGRVSAENIIFKCARIVYSCMVAMFDIEANVMENLFITYP